MSSLSASITADKYAPQSTTYQAMKICSFAHSLVYLSLLTVWQLDVSPQAQFVLGMTHGIGWIAMSFWVLWGVRARVVGLWLAVLIVIIGGLGPFAGTLGFIYAEKMVAKSVRTQYGS